MKAFLFIIFLACIISANAQVTEQNHKYAVKVYAANSFSAYTNTHRMRLFGTNLKTSVYDYVQPGFAIASRTKKGNYQEIELSHLDFSQTENSTFFTDPITGVQSYMSVQRVYHTHIGIRYEYVLTLNKRKDAWFIPSVSLAAMPFFSRYASKPYVSSDYPMSQTAIGVRSFIIPRVNVALSKRLMLDINIPVCITYAGTVWQNIGNPTLPARAQKYRIADFDVLPFYTARLGLGWKI